MVTLCFLLALYLVSPSTQQAPPFSLLPLNLNPTMLQIQVLVTISPVALAHCDLCSFALSRVNKYSLYYSISTYNTTFVKHS